MDSSISTVSVLEVISAVELALCVAVAVVLARRWRRHRLGATGTAFGIFAVVGLVIAVSYVPPSDPTHGWGALWQDVLISVLLSVPYLLVRFTWALGGLGDRVHRVAVALLALEVAVTVAVPPLPEEGDPSPGWVGAYVVLVLAVWVGLSVVAARGLWRAGEGQSSVVASRMRSLSTGGVLMAVTLVLSAAVGEDGAAWLRVVVGLLGLASVLLFALAFLPPAALRVVWRQPDLAVLSTAERGLMAALTRDDVAATIVPVMATVFGGAAVLLDEDGRVVRAVGIRDDEAAELGRDLAAGVVPSEQEVLAQPMSQGWIAVRAGLLAPVFGDDEAVLLSRVGTRVDLALQRVHLYERERASREAAEAANDELETLLYSVSHDLRSPLISVLGYLDVLREEQAAQLSEDGAHYLERITVNAVYMQSLIADLLELSRIGRSDPPAQRLDLQVLADQVADAARLSSPAARVLVQGPLPVLSMSDVRARQLLTNLVDNALKHGGRDDLTVTVYAEPDPSGGVLLKVADDGRGIPPEYRARVLRVFERLDAPRSSPGTGMGLAICKRITESLGGTLVVEGPAPGLASGTTVVLALPAARVIGTPVPSPREAPSAVPAGQLREERT